MAINHLLLLWGFAFPFLVHFGGLSGSPADTTKKKRQKRERDKKTQVRKKERLKKGA